MSTGVGPDSGGIGAGFGAGFGDGAEFTNDSRVDDAMITSVKDMNCNASISAIGPSGCRGHAPAAAPSSSCRQLPDRKTFGCVTVHGAEHRECSPASQPRSSRRRPSPRRPRSSCEPPDLRIGRGCSDRRGIRPRHSGAARVAGMAPAPERKGAGRERRAAAADFLTRASAGIRSSGFPRSLLAFPSRHIPPAPEGAGCGRRRRRWVALEQDPGHWVDGVLPELSQRAVLTSGSTAGSRRDRNLKHLPHALA